MKQTLFERLLDYYHITKEDYDYLTRDVSFSDIPSPDHFKGMPEAVELLEKYLGNDAKIIVYGDYDADGITATSIMVKAFEYLHKKISYYIPSRYIDGYGINLENAKKIVEAGYQLVITVDNGISAFEAISYLRENGVDVLVIDHHERQEELPNANVIIHPIISEYSDVSTSGAYSSFMVASALLKRYDKYLSTLAAISLISDMMPLVSYNRDFLRVIIKNYQYGEFPQIDFLLEGYPFNDNSIGMTIAPKINAVGRVDRTTNINRLVKYFTSENKDELLSYRSWILSLNSLRKEKSKEARENIINNLEDTSEAALVVICDLDDGLLGLVANSLVGKFKKPVVVFTEDSTDPNLLKGSARSVNGVALASLFSQLSDCEETFGGHALAAGVSIKKENYEVFKEKFISLVASIDVQKVEEVAVDITLNEISKETYDLIETFGPFGESWKSPLLRVRRIKANSLMYSRNGENIISSIGFNSRIVGFGLSKDEMSEYNYVDFTGNIRISEFNGKKYYEFVVKDFTAND